MLRPQIRLCAVILSLAVAAIAQSNFPTNEDLRHFRAIADPRLSPDGQRILYRVTDATADGGRSHLWLTDLATNTARQLTFSPDADKRGEHSGEWLPDGSAILFIAKRGEHSQLFRLPMSGGESQAFDLKALPVVDATKSPAYISTTTTPSKPEEPKPLPIDVNSFAVSPDGKLVAVVARDPESAAEKKQKDDKADAQWIDHEEHGLRLYLLELATEKLTTTSVPPDVDDLAWTPDSRKLLVFTEAPNNQSDLGPSRKGYTLDINTPDHVSPVDKLPPTVRSASWTNDGKLLYFLAQAQQDTPPGTFDLYEFNPATNAIHNLTDGFNGSIEFEKPIPLLSGGVLKAVSTGVKTTAIRLKPNAGATEMLKFPTPLAGSFQTNAKQTGWVFLGASSTQPTTIYYTADLGQTPRAIAVPKTTPDNARTVEPRLIRYPSEKFTIEGLLYLPSDAGSKKVPLVMDIHGGPSGAFQDGYDPFVAYLNGQGWAVFRPNIRGSSNYGAAFVAANKNRPWWRRLSRRDERRRLPAEELSVRPGSYGTHRIQLRRGDGRIRRWKDEPI